MALDFGILQPANISGQLQAGQESAMRNQLAQQQLASGRTEQEMSQMKLSELKRNTAALESMQRKFLENGKSDDMDANYDAMISSGIPHFMDIGIKAKQTLAQTRIDYATMGLPMPSYLQPKGQGAATGAPAPGAPAQGSVSKPFTPEQVLEEERRWAQMAMGGSTKGLAPMLDSKGNLLNPMTPERRALDEQRLQQMADGTAGMAMPAVTGRPIQPEQALNVVSRSEGSPSPIPTANMLAPAAAPATNMLAPPPAAPANALAAPGMSVEEQRARTMLLSQNPGVRAAGQAELNRLMTLHTLAPGSSLRDASGRIIAQAPEKPPAPPSMVAEYTFAKTPDGGNFRGSYQDFVTARAAAGRAPAQPVAPTITQIIDPTNPNQMISVDARRYQGGGVGSPGVIGVGGKEPGAAIRINKAEEGKTQLANDLDNLRSSFTELDRLRAIPSTERNVASNLMSAAQATGVGQVLGRAGGTKEQVERDVINSARQRLVASIKNATGMSSKSLDSNMELQTMLRSISDPGQSVEAAMRIIQDIEDAYVTGKGMKKREEPAPAPGASQGTGGFKYLGKESTK
jgi:hypothetical protein